ncbi:MAG TPA: hypothetical protein VMT59_09635 [Gaiellaceae bacterium]|nr:hypothetical protein [Gaiellaceae bacterium]
MFRARILAAVVVLGAFAAFAASPADAARPAVPGVYPNTMMTQHFLIHYTNDLADSDRIVEQQAADLTILVEQAYTQVVSSWGFPAPPDDGDGKIDIWVTSGALSGAESDSPIDPLTGWPSFPSTGWIALDPGSIEDASVIEDALFGLDQFGIWVPTDAAGAWLQGATTTWADLATQGFPASSAASPDMSLDCVNPVPGALPPPRDPCSDPGSPQGSSRWPFIEYLSERYGMKFVIDYYKAGQALGPGATGMGALNSVLQAKGENLSDAFDDYTARVVAGNFQIDSLKGDAPETYSQFTTGAVNASLSVLQVAVNHLAARYIDFHSDVTDTGPCYAATLALTVAIPAGVGHAQPYFFSSGVGASAIPLTLNGNTASLNVPWNNCAGHPDGYLSLPNPSLASDDQIFTVSGSLTVDPTTPATNTPPPDPLYAGPGPFVAAPATDVAPSILVHGAEVIRVSTVDRLVRLLVFSSGDGQLQASAGTTNLGTYQLRAGNNDVRFKLPQSIVNALRKPAGKSVSASTLTLKFLSPGGLAGTTVSRKLALVKPTPTKKKKKD